MITKFDSLFAGHVDMDNVGYGGVPVNDRRFPNEHLATVFDKAQAMAQLMDRLGYDTFWMAEHHFQREGYECIPNVLMTALHLAHMTKRIRLGCGFNITPMWHPLRLVEDYATADILSGGRITFGVGRGYHTREVETFGSPLLDQPANRELFEEQVDIIFKAFNNDAFSHQGKHYTLPPQVPYRGYTLEELTVVPRPLRLPVECWQPIQGGSERALDFMAKHGIQGLVGGGSAEGGAMHNVVLAWQKAHAKIGKHLELGERMCFGFHFFIADSREAGIREAGKYYEENMKMFGELRLGPGADRRADRDHARPQAGARRQIAADRGRDQRRRRPVRLAAADHRPPEGAGAALSRPRPGLGQPLRRGAEIGRSGTARTLRQGGHAGLSAGQGARDGGRELIRSGRARRRVSRQPPPGFRQRPNRPTGPRP